ncbi:MAG: hypothetical protein WB524_19875 [Acidobacteriaceae bacterium]
MNSTMRKAQNLLQRVPGVLLLLPLFTPGLAPAQQVGQNGVAIWELSRPRMNAMLTLVPRDDEARYDRLRQDFIGFGCTGNSLREQAVDRKGHHKNLLCSLPGSNQQEIIVAAWYPHRRSFGKDASDGWAAAVMLPILYNSLSAEPHRYTFLFAAFAGEDGEYHFLRSVGKTPQRPAAFIGLDAPGLGVPYFWAVPPNLLDASHRAAAQTISDTAWNVARLQGFASDKAYSGHIFSGHPGVFPSALLDDPKEIPRILIYSYDGGTITLDAYREDHDFIAFYLCGLDIKLAAAFDPATRASH